jgi:hypothetical protein
MIKHRLSQVSRFGISLLVTLSVFGFVMSSCGSDGASCSENAECSDGYYCRGPNHPNACGIPPREICASDTDCPMGTVCHAVYDSCSPDNLGSECFPPCTTSSCGPGFRCNATGACETIPCDEGFTCPERQKCDPAVAHASVPMFSKTNGCVDITCSNDSACPTGKVCVTGFCQDGAGACREDIAVP